jgi:hypothetical protein
MPALTAGGMLGHAAITAAKSGSAGIAGSGFDAESPESAPDSAPLSDGPCAIPDDFAGCSGPVWPTSILGFVAYPQ